MADAGTYPPFIDTNTGFCSTTKIFHSLRKHVPLPPGTSHLSFTSFAFSLLPSPLPTNPALVDGTTGVSISYTDLVSKVQNLSSSLQSKFHLSKGDVAFIISPSRLDIPILYLSLLSIGVIITVANPASTPPEISHQIKLTKPCIAFATSSTVQKLTSNILTVLLDSEQFSSLLNNKPSSFLHPVDVRQTDVAAIHFSSGTTGRVKAAAIPHRSFIAQAAGFHAHKTNEKREVMLLVAPMFHSFGFFFALRGVALGSTTVVMERVRFPEMMRVVERFGATLMTAAPPVVVAMARSEEMEKYDFSKLETVLSGGAPLPVEAGKRFMKRFPRVELRQGYGSTEGGGISRMISLQECRYLRSAGRLTDNVEAKIVDVTTGKALSVGQQGELYARGPAVMIGYVGDNEANASTFDSEGWLKTGDLCYFDNNGFLYIVDRLKELIKYKAYQVPPAELEHLLQSIPDIIDVAVIPYPHEEVGQIPMAIVVRQPGSNLSEAQVIDFVAKQVAPYKKIRKVVFTNSIPKSAAGKILRRELSGHALCNPMPRL